VKELGEPRALQIRLEHLSKHISDEDEGRGERSFKLRCFLPIAPYSTCRSGATWPGVSTVRPGQSWPRPGLVCETQSTLVHGPRAHWLFGAGLVWTGSAGGLGERGRSHDPLASYPILGGEWVSRFSTTTKPLLEAHGIHHNNRYRIVHTSQSTGNRRRRLSKNSVNRRRDGGTASEIRWVFLVLWVGFLLLGAFGRHHNNRQKIVHTRKCTGNIRVSRLNSANRRRDGGVVRVIRSAFLGLWVSFRVLGYT